MTALMEVVHRPPPDADYRKPSRYRTAGIYLGLFGLALAVVTLVANVVAGIWVDDPARTLDVDQTLSWSFGLTTTAFAVLKIGIAVVLVGIIARLWMRVDSVKSALLALKPKDSHPEVRLGRVETDFGPATATKSVPSALPIHKMAKNMWAPMLAMGAMAVLAGLVLSLIRADNLATDPGLARAQGAWVQGLQFLGEGLILSGISFLLGTILAGLRAGGGEVQQSQGVVVKTLLMPATAKAFIVLMMTGLMISIAQFVGYVVAANVENPQSFAAWLAWLGPFRELGLGLILAGIVLALVSIGTVLRFQFDRITQIIRTGR